MVEYTLIRSDRKTLSLELDRAGALIVRAPRRLDRAAIDRFVESRSRWVEEKRQVLRARAAAVAPETQPGESLWLGGKRRPVERCGVREPVLCGDRVQLPPQWTQEQLRVWLKAEARRQIAARLPVLAAQTGLRPSGVHVTEAKTRWGSCSSKNSLSFAWRLVFCPPDVVDYVLVHELCHIRHKNHSPAFWALVARYDPQFETHKTWLRDHAALMELFCDGRKNS